MQSIAVGVRDGKLHVDDRRQQVMIAYPAIPVAVEKPKPLREQTKIAYIFKNSTDSWPDEADGGFSPQIERGGKREGRRRKVGSWDRWANG
jgi:hypothetical protein